MFDNIGRKIKTLAEVCTWVGIIVSAIWGLIILAEGEMLGLIIAVAGSVGAWISSFLLYGFGQLIENTDVLAGGRNMNVPEKGNGTEKIATLEKWKNDGLISEKEYQEGIAEAKGGR